MRKKTVSHVADTIFWYVLYFLPVILYIIMLWGRFNSDSFWTYFVNEDFDYTNLFVPGDSFNVFWESLGLDTDNFLAENLSLLFGSADLGLSTSNWQSFLPLSMSWFVYVYLTHLAVDFLLFIPRLAHKWMNKFTRCE